MTTTKSPTTTGAEMKKLAGENKVVPVDTGDLLEIDGVTYEVKVYRRDYIDLIAVTS